MHSVDFAQAPRRALLGRAERILLERIVVRQFLYHTIITLPTPFSFSFTDQYAFRPTGPTTADVIAFVHSVTDLISSNPFVVVLASDFSKAFDTVRHATVIAPQVRLAGHS